MEAIYIKLGPGINYYHHSVLNFTLEVGHIIAVALDFLNIDSDITQALNNQTIVQITEQQYYALPNNNPSNVVIPSNTLLTAKNFIIGCPQTGDEFWLVRGGILWKILYSDLKNCLQSKYHLEFTIGDISNEPGLTLPTISSTSFIIPKLIGKDIKVEYNGLPIYKKINPLGIYYIWNKGLGDFSLSTAAFNSGDYLAIYQL